MPPRRRSTGPTVYQLKLTLKRIRPPIWRRLQVLGDTRLDALHEIFQTAMGWWDAHLHQFVAGGQEDGVPDPDFADDTSLETRATLANIAPFEGEQFVYEYDFGDGWEHEVLVEKLLPVEPGVAYPRCLTGRRACPPEDCGGPWGYADLLEALADPAHPDHDEMLEWVGGEFDPAEFDREAVAAALRPLPPPPPQP